ncbi:protein arginine kinase [Listeria booriae]|uniref:Protein-arginine kinase n=1 Tax=Listeria booriae TaxID=1552123 RepID=A0A842A2B7_9LIST|nr:protein arginine kinase [Listeria booriae]MBC1566560.1 protein arginine kinase [Listeria booriae]MBC1575062.1 protein arginine kinase [Listeria booriae]MBC2037446.1 protein arginine kinase [Listeria booriae]MBC2057733.1 protein arginine kinase [Listeria booriae]
MGSENLFKPVLSSWLEQDGPQSDVVISSRVRLARNFKDWNFSGAGVELFARVREEFGTRDGFSFLAMGDLSVLERGMLVERHLISPEMMRRQDFGAVMVSDDERASVMFNEEDHIRIQCMAPGLQLEQVLNEAFVLDDELEINMPYAFDERLGYLTTCVTNVGTGLRASVMVHLPGLVATKQLQKTVEAIRRYGFVVRGMYGEGSRPASNIFQISNQVTLGKTELEIVQDLSDVMEQVIMQERVCRTKLKQTFHIAMEDRIFRAYGVLKHSRILAQKEAADAISDLRLGIQMGYVEHIPSQKVNELILFSQPAFLRRFAQRDMNELEEKVIRAAAIREILDTY